MSYSFLSGASGAQKGFFGYLHQVGKAVTKKDWYRAAELVVTCPGSPVPGITCPNITDKNVESAIQDPVNLQKIQGWIRRHIIGGRDWWGNPFTPPEQTGELDAAIQREFKHVNSTGALTPEEEAAILAATMPVAEPEASFLRRNAVPLFVGGGTLLIGTILMIAMIKV